MSSIEDNDDSVKISAPDRSLQVRIGMTNLDKLFTPVALEAAQNVITNSSETFLSDSLKRMEELALAFQAFSKSPDQNNEQLDHMIEAAFAIKTDTGIGGYTLIANIAKSLQLHAERYKAEGLPARSMDLLKWHIDGIQQCLNLHIKGTGGATGAAILKEIERLSQLSTE